MLKGKGEKPVSHGIAGQIKAAGVVQCDTANLARWLHLPSDIKQIEEAMSKAAMLMGSLRHSHSGADQMDEKPACAQRPGGPVLTSRRFHTSGSAQLSRSPPKPRPRPHAASTNSKGPRYPGFVF
jgi:hypothetical protein